GVHFDPGSSCLNILEAETQQARPALSADLVRLVQVTEVLPQFAAQSTAIVCNDVPQEIGDWVPAAARSLGYGKADRHRRFFCQQSAHTHRSSGYRKRRARQTTAESSRANVEDSEHRGRERIPPGLNALDQAVRGGDGLGIDHQLLNAVAGEEI